ncbi:transposase, IS4 [Desulfovibrio sp. X2]|nr:transposase, IS4 [Desulfovibrio sp. X2]
MPKQNGLCSIALLFGHIKMHLVERGLSEQEIGKSRGGYSTKVHATTDSLGCPTLFILSPRNASDHLSALLLLDGQEADCVIADRGYDSNEIAAEVKKMGAEPVIQPRSHRNAPREYDRYLYRERNLIERMFCRLKQFRRIASRYDKLSSSYLSFLHIASISIWLA